MLIANQACTQIRQIGNPLVFAEFQPIAAFHDNWLFKIHIFPTADFNAMVFIQRRLNCIAVDGVAAFFV